MEKTKNYNLKKPGAADFYDVTDFNENAEAVDRILKEINEQVTATGEDLESFKNGISYVTFEQKGAKGDGVTDDTEAIKAALQEAGDSGKTVLIGKATYLLKERVVIDKSVNMIGSGADDSVIKFRADETHQESAYDTEWWEGSNAAMVVKADHCIFSNFTLTGGENENEASLYNGLIFHYPYKYPNYWGYEAAQRVSMSQCVIQGFKNGLYMFGGWNRYFNGCYFKQCSDAGVRYEPLEVARLGEYTSSGDIFEACQITGCKGYGIDISYVYENYFVNCVMEYNGRAIRAVNCRDLTFKTCWNEANFNNIQVTGNVRFEGGFNISNTTVEHTLNAPNDVVVFTENGDTTICRQQKIIYRQVGGVVVKGVEIGAEIENNILNPYWEEEVGGSKVQVSTDHWNPYTSEYCTISTTEKYKGRNSAKIDVSGLTQDQDFGWRTERLLINDGTTYTLSFAAKVTDFQAVNDAGGLCVYVQWLNSTGVATLNANQMVTFSSNEWEEKSITLTPNSNSAYVIIGFGFKRNGTAYVSCPALTDNSSVISSDVRVTQGTGTSGKVVYFRSADGNMIGSIDLEQYKDGDSLTAAVAEMTAQMRLINNELYGTDIELESEDGVVKLTPLYEDGVISSCTLGDTLIIRTRNLFDYKTYTQHTSDYMGYIGINLADLVYIKPSTKYTCSTSATSGNTLYFGTGLDAGVDESGGKLTATSDSDGNLYIWILSGRDHYQDMIDGKITIQVEEGESATEYVEHMYKTVELDSDPASITMYANVENILQEKEGNPFKLTYSGKKLEDKVMETVYDSPSFEGSVSMGRSPGYEVGENSTALGLKVAATGYASHAEGVGSKAAGEYSHAEGDNSKAEAHSAHAEGTGCKAGGVASHAEGSSCTASGIASHAEGTSCTASGNRSHAEGNVCKATGEHSHAEGDNTVAAGEYSHVQGRYNAEDTDNKYAHIVGGGTSWADRKNIHTVDWDGNAYFAGNIQTGENGTPFGYEEGEWTPSTTSALNFSKLTNCKYKKIGNVVFIQAYLIADGSASMWTIDGLPYPVATSGATDVGTVQALPIQYFLNGTMNPTNMASYNGTANQIVCGAISASGGAPLVIQGYYFTE